MPSYVLLDNKKCIVAEKSSTQVSDLLTSGEVPMIIELTERKSEHEDYPKLAHPHEYHAQRNDCWQQCALRLPLTNLLAETENQASSSPQDEFNHCVGRIGSIGMPR